AARGPSSGAGSGAAALPGRRAGGRALGLLLGAGRVRRGGGFARAAPAPGAGGRFDLPDLHGAVHRPALLELDAARLDLALDQTGCLKLEAALGADRPVDAAADDGVLGVDVAIDH